MILACQKKNLVNKHKQVGMGQTPPPPYGENSPLIPFFFLKTSLKTTKFLKNLFFPLFLIYSDSEIQLYIYIFQIVSSYKHHSYSHYFVATGVVCVRRAFLQSNSAGQQSSQTSSSSAQHISVYSFVSQERQTSSSSFPR